MWSISRSGKPLGHHLTRHDALGAFNSIKGVVILIRRHIFYENTKMNLFLCVSQWSNLKKTIAGCMKMWWRKKINSQDSISPQMNRILCNSDLDWISFETKYKMHETVKKEKTRIPQKPRMYSKSKINRFKNSTMKNCDCEN